METGEPGEAGMKGFGGGKRGEGEFAGHGGGLITCVVLGNRIL